MRRDFAALHSVLTKRIPGAIIPEMPEGGVASQVVMATGNEMLFVETRTKVTARLLSRTKNMCANLHRCPMCAC